MIRALKNCKYKYKNVISLSTLSFLVRLLKNPIKEHHLEPISKLKQKKRTAPDPGRRNNRSHPDSKHCIYPRSLLLPGSDTECGGPGPASHGPALQAVLRSHITEESMIMIICRFILVALDCHGPRSRCFLWSRAGGQLRVWDGGAAHILHGPPGILGDDLFPGTQYFISRI